MRHIAFRLDANEQVGVGHLMRCLTLAQWLLSQHKESVLHFITGPISRALSDKLTNLGAKHLILTNDPNPIRVNTPHGKWLNCNNDFEVDQILQYMERQNLSRFPWFVCDHYGLDATYLKKIADFSQQILVIDDIADRQLYCDLLVNPTYGFAESSYEGRLPDKTKKYIGAQYAFLRKEFSDRRHQAEATKGLRQDDVKVLIFLGGGDPKNVTKQVLQALTMTQSRSRLCLTVIVGTEYQFMEQLKDPIKMWPKITLLQNVDNMAELMLDHDFAIGASGSSAWERCCVGLPTIQIAFAQNQQEISRQLAQAGACLDGGSVIGEAQHNIDLAHVAYCVDRLANDLELRNQMRLTGFKICDGLGAQRILRAMKHIEDTQYYA